VNAARTTTFVNIERTADCQDLVGVGAGWFSSAFEVAFGATTSEALERFHDELAMLVDTFTDLSNEGTAKRFRDAVTNVMYRLSVAAEWAERVERIADAREAAR